MSWANDTVGTRNTLAISSNKLYHDRFYGSHHVYIRTYLVGVVPITADLSLTATTDYFQETHLRFDVGLCSITANFPPNGTVVTYQIEPIIPKNAPKFDVESYLWLGKLDYISDCKLEWTKRVLKFTNGTLFEDAALSMVVKYDPPSNSLKVYTRST